jgi:hypothetical protein
VSRAGGESNHAITRGQYALDVQTAAGKAIVTIVTGLSGSVNVCQTCSRSINCGLCLPFKLTTFRPVQENSTSSRPLAISTPNRPDLEHRYPDPGYQGSSSHVTIFNRVSEQRRLGDGIIEDSES